MDNHFNKVVGPHANNNASKFIPAKSFEGRKPGYVFHNGDFGIGYYLDNVLHKSYDAAIEEKVDRKRKLEDVVTVEDVNDEDDDADADEAPSGKSIDKLLEEAEDVAPLDASSLKQLLVSFEKKITKNQKQRMKYSDEPEKFMDSELELNAEIQELFAIAASPELYPILVQMGSVNSILGMITHENTDISIATINLLQEMTDVDSVLEEVDKAMEFINAFVAGQGLELIVQNLSRLDETNEEDAQGVHNSLAIIENLVEINPELSVTLCDKTHILKYLLERLKAKKFDANKLYCSEILSILLQTEKNQLRLCAIAGLDGMDLLLQTIAVYRKKEVDALDEQECVENLFLCLCSVLMPRENQFKFLACEGFELLIRCLQEQQYAAGCTISALNYAIVKNKQCAAKLIDVGGFKHVFPLLVGKGFKKSLKRKGTGEKRNIEETVLSIVSQLCSLLYNEKRNDYGSRLLSKLGENEGEKIERCAELFVKYSLQLETAEQEIEQTRATLLDADDLEELEEFDQPENILSRRLEGGLFNMQQLAIIIGFACVFDKNSFKKAEIKLASDGMSMAHVLDTLRDHVQTLRETMEEAAAENSSSSSGDNGGAMKSTLQEKEEAHAYVQLLTEWCAVLATSVDTKW